MKQLTIFVFILSICFFSMELSAQTYENEDFEKRINEYKKEDSVKVNLLNNAAFELRKIDLEKTFKYADEAGKLADKINFLRGKAESLRIIGLYHYYKSEYPKALEYYKKAITISEKLGDKNGISRSFNNIGNVYRRQGNYPKALEYFQKSLKIAEIIGLKSVISSSIGNIGLVYWKEGNYSQALVYYKKSLKIYEELGNKKGVSNALNNIGILYYYEVDYSKSLEYFQKSLKIDEELKDKSGISYSMHNVGEILRYQGNYSLALEYLQKSLKLREELGDKSGICSSYSAIGAVYLKTKNYKKAIDYTEKSLKIAIELELLDKQKEIYEQLSEIYEGTKNYERAYKNHVLFKTINDSVFNEENIKKITGLEHQYEYEKEKQAAELIQQKKDAVYTEKVKRQKIISNSFIAGFIFMFLLGAIIFFYFLQKRRANIVLKLQKNETEEKNMQLKQLNDTQNRLMSIISHDFKAPLSAFYSITRSLKTKFDKFNKEEIDNYFNRMLNSSAALKLQLENMLNWAINQSREIKVNKNKFNLYTIAYKTVIILQEFANEKSIIIENEINEDIEILTDGKLLGIVFNNLITNAIKFSQPKSKVIISGKQEAEKIILSVKDFGVGMSQADTKCLFTTQEKMSQNKNRGTGLGLIVSKDITEKLGGKIWAESELNIGTEIFIELSSNE